MNYHPNGDRIYRVLREIRYDGGVSYNDWLSGGTTVAIREHFPEIEAAARASASQHTRVWLRAGGKTLSDWFCSADKEILEVFDFEFVRGGLLTSPMTAVVTESVARRFFGDADPIGQTITLVDTGPMGDYKITGILKDIPKYASIRIGVITAAPPSDYVNREARNWEGWVDNLWGPKNYVLLPEGFSTERVEQVLNDVMSRSIPKEMAAKTTIHLLPMSEARLYGEGGPGDGTIHDITFYVMILVIIGAVACANYINLAVARTVARKGEIASRKAIGARARDIILQFVTEACVISAAALVLGFVLASLDSVAGLFGGHLVNANAADWRFIAGNSCALVLISLAAGFYPGVVAARSSARDTGDGSGSAGSGRLSVRNVLVVGQLACAVFFITSTIVVRSQTSRMESADVGFDIDQVLTTRFVFNDSTMRSRRDLIKAAFTRTPGVESATTMWPGPGMETVFQTAYPDEAPVSGREVQVLGVDPDWLKTYGVELIAGRNVGPNFVKNDNAEFVLNETAVDRLGWGETGSSGAVGKSLRVRNRRGIVIGVVRDFHYSALRDPIPPLVMMNWSRIALAIRIRTENVEETMTAIDRTWKEHFDQPNQFRFVEQMWGFGLWRERNRVVSYTMLSWAAIVLAGLGVLGLASYETEQRRREIGVRKVLGATISGIVAMLWKGHVLLVIIAALIGWVAAYNAVGAWLQEFAYRIDLSAAPFLWAGAAVSVLFLAVVGIQAARVGRVDPAETLRSE